MSNVLCHPVVTHNYALEEAVLHFMPLSHHPFPNPSCLAFELRKSMRDASPHFPFLFDLFFCRFLFSRFDAFVYTKRGTMQHIDNNVKLKKQTKECK